MSPARCTALTTAGVIVLDDPAAQPDGEPETGAIRRRMLVPAREALAQGEYEKAAGALQEVLRADPLMPEARRLLGVCQAALGRFRGALRPGSLEPARARARPAKKR